MGNSDDLMIGESVIAFGNPFGFSHTVTTGVVSSVNRSIKTASPFFHEFIPTDASDNPGNGGGRLLHIFINYFPYQKRITLGLLQAAQFSQFFSIPVKVKSFAFDDHFAIFNTDLSGHIFF